MSNLSGFNANDVPESNFGALPHGFYTVMATASERKPTKAGNAEFLQFTIDILDEQYNNRKVWARLNLWNPSATAVAIAQRELADLCLAVGIPSPDDSSELLNKPFVVELVIEKEKATGKESNKIAKYFSIDANPAEAQTTAPATQAPAATTAPAATGATKTGPVWGQR